LGAGGDVGVAVGGAGVVADVGMTGGGGRGEYTTVG